MKAVGKQGVNRAHERTLAIEAGQVVCHRRGIVDIEECWSCSAYRGLSSGRIEGLICRADTFALPQAIASLVDPFTDDASDR